MLTLTPDAAQLREIERALTSYGRYRSGDWKVVIAGVIRALLAPPADQGASEPASGRACRQVELAEGWLLRDARRATERLDQWKAEGRYPADQGGAAEREVSKAGEGFYPTFAPAPVPAPAEGDAYERLNAESEARWNARYPVVGDVRSAAWAEGFRTAYSELSAALAQRAAPVVTEEMRQRMVAAIAGVLMSYAPERFEADREVYEGARPNEYALTCARAALTAALREGGRG